ncbi:Ig-like domain-containing protein [Salmonella enterica]
MLSREEKSSHIKILAWLNIGIQMAFPLVTAFTPTITQAKLLTENHQEITFATKVYTLSAGENITSVARKYQISIDELRKLNQFRTFAHGFNNLQAGDEIDVPLAPLTKKEVNPQQQEKEADGARTAGWAMKFGSMFADRPDGNATSSAVRGMATSAASAQVQQWLNRVGTARVQIDADENLSFKNSQLDLLVPVYDQKNHLAFTQSSVHRTDDRLQANLGLGYRWFAPGWMLGGNTFFDYDLSNKNARLGLGIEYWRDYLKLSANSYLRLTNWQDSKSLEDYQERPANGWDLRAQGWLPALPQLGAKVMYEQYYGKEVAMFGNNNRQSDPHAVTVGLNYTPIPLLTFGADLRQDAEGNQDSQFSMALNYQLGVPWNKQIDPDAVGAMRTLMGSRYDLVERNNNIVLEYRKKELIQLRTAALITGYAGEKKSLNVTVNSKYPLQHIDWSAPALLAAGGKIIQEGGNNYSVILPEYHSEAKGINTYTISGAAVDDKGNSSPQSTTQVTVTQAAINANSSSLTPNKITLPADGKSEQEFVLKIMDRQGQPINVSPDEITVSRQSKLRGTITAKLTNFSRRVAGEYVATLTAGTRPESFTFTPSARNTRFPTATVAMTADTSTALVNSVAIVTNGALADGKAENSIKVVLVDAQNNRVPAKTFDLSADHNAIVSATAVTDKNGEAIIPVMSPYAGDVTVTASVDGKPGKKVTLNFVPDQKTAEIKAKNFTITPEFSLADGKTRKTVQAILTDARDNPVSQTVVTFAADNSAVLSATSVKTDAKGIAQTTIISKVAGVSHVTATVNQKTTTRDTTFTGNAATALVSAVTTTASSGIADGATGIKFQALVKDQNNNPLANIPVDWKSDRDNSAVTFSAVQSKTNAQGIAETAVSSTKAYDVVVTASTNASSKSASPFTFVADSTKGSITQLTANRSTLKADGKDSPVLTVKVADRFGNPLSGTNVSLSNGEGAVITPVQTVTATDGTAQVALTTKHVGAINVTAVLDNGAKARVALNAIADTQTATVKVATSALTATVGGTPVTMTATVVDANNNPVSGTSVAWRSDANQLDTSVSTTNDRGEATIRLSATQAVQTTVTAVLYNGNSASAQTTFAAAEPVTANSQLTVSPQAIAADGSTMATATLLLKDRFGNPTPGQNINWNANETSVTFAPKEQGKGIYLAQVTGTKEGTWTLTATSGKAQLQTSLGFLANQNTVLIDSVRVYGNDTAKADGQEKVTLRVQVKDKNNNTAMPGVAVGWRTTLGTLASPLSKTDAQGIAEMTLTSTQAGQATVAAMLGGGQPVNADKTVTFTAGTVSGSTSSLSVAPATITVGTENATLSLAVNDVQGNPLSGMSGDITLQYAPDLSLTVSAFNEVAPGRYTAQLNGKKAGSTTITALVKGTMVDQKVNLTLKADNSTAVVNGNISVTPAAATVGQTVTYSAVLTDKFGNALGDGIPVTWSANAGSLLSAPVTTTDTSGTATVTLTREQAGIATVSMILPSGATSAPNVVFSAGTPDENQSELTLTPSVIIAGKETSTLNLVLRDSKGNLLEGQTVSGVSTNPNVTFSNSVESKKGNYTITVSANRAGLANLTVKVGNVTFNQSKPLTIKGDTSSWKITRITADRASFTAGDAKGVTYTATVVDAQGNILPDVVVSWQLQGKADSFAETSLTNQSGIATSTVLSNSAGTLLMSAWLDPKNSVQASVVTVNPGDIDTNTSTFSADRNSIGADGIEAVTLTVALKDSYSNPISGKNVTINGASALKGFTVSSVTDNNDGTYTVKGTSTAKGQVTLNAIAEGKTIGSGIPVTVGPINLNLTFANAQQRVSWARNFTASQAVNGMPVSLAQTWTSSDDSVAKVDSNGKISLLKAGNARITVHTAGNSQYNPAIAAYDLIVEKANPQLAAANGSLITSTWSDGKSYSAAAKFGNADATGVLAPSYISKNTNIVTVDSSGALTAIKPGAATVTLSTPETEQFMAQSVDVAYVLNKATPQISFKTAKETVKFASGKNMQFQTPDLVGITANSLQWSSSDTTVATVNGAQLTMGGGLGGTVIRADHPGDDYYLAASGQYEVQVYDSPAATLTPVAHTSLGDDSTSSTWNPVFTTDTVSTELVLNGDAITRPVTKITATLTDSGGEKGKYELSGTNIKYGTIIPMTINAGKLELSNITSSAIFKIVVTGINNEEVTLLDRSLAVKPRTTDLLRMVNPSIKAAPLLWDTSTNNTTICSGNDWATLNADFSIQMKPNILKYYSDNMQYKAHLDTISWTPQQNKPPMVVGMQNFVAQNVQVKESSGTLATISTGFWGLSRLCGTFEFYSYDVIYNATYDVKLDLQLGNNGEENYKSSAAFTWKNQSPLLRPSLVTYNF